MSCLASSTLRIGDIAPDFTLLSVDGTEVPLASCLHESPVALVFAPGTWSPATRRQIEQLGAASDLFHAMDVAVVLVLSQDAARVRRAFVGNPSPLKVLVDPTRDVARDYGVYRAWSRDGIGVCRPAVFLVDRSGVIRFLYIGNRADDAPEVESLLLLTAWLVPGAQPASAEQWPQSPGEPTEDEPSPPIELPVVEAADTATLQAEDGRIAVADRGTDEAGEKPPELPDDEEAEPLTSVATVAVTDSLADNAAP